MNHTRIYRELTGKLKEEKAFENNDISEAFSDGEFGDWLKQDVTISKLGEIESIYHRLISEAENAGSSGDDKTAVVKLIRAKQTKEILDLCQTK